MPTYDYGCETCGPFSEIRPMAEFALPQPCPTCSEPAPRAMLYAPALGGASAPQDAAAPRPRLHPGGCSCCAAPRRFAAEAV
jgi:putative FmdB family regulatory protein